MKEAANSLLKILEEPPEFATIFLLTDNRGRAAADHPFAGDDVYAGRLAAEEIERDLATQQSGVERETTRLVARLSGGAIGRARGFDLAKYTAARAHALTILNTALRTGDHSELFKVTETYRPGADGREKIGAACCGRSTPCFRI